MGPGFTSSWPKFASACWALGFDQAAAECRMREQGNPGVVARNDAGPEVLRNAARVLNPDNGYDPDTLYYPAVLLDAVVLGGEESANRPVR